MNTSTTIERRFAEASSALDRTEELKPEKSGKVAGSTDRRKARPPHGSVRRWQMLFASFLRRL